LEPSNSVVQFAGTGGTAGKGVNLWVWAGRADVLMGSVATATRQVVAIPISSLSIEQLERVRFAISHGSGGVDNPPSPTPPAGQGNPGEGSGNRFGNNDLVLGRSAPYPSTGYQGYAQTRAQNGGKLFDELVPYRSGMSLHDQIREAMNKADHIHFQLDGITPEFFANSNYLTMWEFQTIKGNPDLLNKTTFYIGGQVVELTSFLNIMGF